jgi:uncharacterized protein YxjI
MKRSLADITQKLFRKPVMAVLIPKDLNHPTYWIYEATGHRLVGVLREIELRKSQDRILVMVNTQGISPRDYIVEESGSGLLIKFIKDRFEFDLDNDDYIEIHGDIEKYA